ncbi:GH36-type glycosyl hydrolase domain-containing protein [Parasphingorhabdus sp.]|uniref:GH36-type glycosyl hydrolase domain-containing protein n=1 Tax=Parasphingorhabdus sp. TaxID=2709688 RepID=UPI003A944E67
MFEKDQAFENSGQDANNIDKNGPDRIGSGGAEAESSSPLEWLAAHVHEPHQLVSAAPRPVPLWKSIEKAVDWLNDAREACAIAPAEASKAAEWLLDNDYQVFRAIRQIKEDLPSRYYEQLPTLDDDGEPGFPRVYGLAHLLLRATHLQVTLPAAVQFICAYQGTHPLTIGELWAFPSMLRIACLEILVGSLTSVLKDQLEKPFEPTEAVAALSSLDDTERVARSIANLSLIASISWEDFFDKTSLVEEILVRDPSEYYARMDFETRNRYRSIVEKLAIYCEDDEPAIATKALEHAKSAVVGEAGHHVGYWLIGAGRREFEESLGVKLPLSLRLKRAAIDHAGLLYASSLLLVWLGAFIIPTVYLYFIEASPLEFAGSLLVMLLPASVLSTSLVQRLATLIVSPEPLPKLDFTDGLPANSSTIVVIPALIAKLSEVSNLVEQVEGHWLSNHDDNLQVALLADLGDAAEEHLETDDAIIQKLISEFSRLNANNGSEKHRPFHLLMRRREYNEHEGCWMAWERKRGKLEQFNRLLLNGDDSGFSVYEGKRAQLDDVRFVVTVDVDTILPPGSVAKLAATLAHPENSARFHPQTGQLVSGYSILQPRVEMAPQSVSRTLFARFFAGDTAIDIYSHAVSNVYQDLFGSGIFVGKGIYDVAAFHRSVAGRIPENTILSHDLLEGAMGRAGLASDIVLYEGFPGTYLEYAKRWHRWVRGDWQLLPWLGRFVAASNGEKIRNRLSGLDRWKIIDNLRRSLIAPSLLLMVAVGWLLLPGNPWFWTFLAVFAHGGQIFTDLITGLSQGRRRGAVRGLFAQLADQSGRWFLAIAYLPFESFVAVHAILVALWRQYVSHRHMLQWTSAAHESARQALRNSPPAIWLQMASAPATAAILGVAIFILNPVSLPAAAPALLLWFLAPEITVLLNRPRHKPVRPLDHDDRIFLRDIARRTWLFFETFAGPKDNWLPPDNYQGEPYPEIAHRTSPTNIGMLLLSSASAWDLGYLGAKELIARTGNCYDTLDRLETLRGHFLNWYDTVSLHPLEPRYVSVVDSGNLAGCMIAMTSLLEEMEDSPAIEPQRWDGLDDILRLLLSAIDAFENNPEELKARVRQLRDQILGLASEPRRWHSQLDEICRQDIPAIEKLIATAMATPDAVSTSTLREVDTWLDRLRHHVEMMSNDIEKLAPWLTLGDPPTGLEADFEQIVEILGDGLSAENQKQAYMIIRQREPGGTAEENWLRVLEESLDNGQKQYDTLVLNLRKLSKRTAAFVDNMDFRPFYDRDRRLFHIGYNASADRLDRNYYDLLASEARLASYFAIAQQQVPVEHWFHLGRPVMRNKKGLSLISWNGSMFEYLMPRLLMRSGPETLLYESEKVAILTQQAYAAKTGTPWGVSESAYAARDPEHRYQYQAFGVPGLGLRRGLAKDKVIAPYASALALQIFPAASTSNIRDMVDRGFSGQYGLFEAVDFTDDRLATGHTVNPVHAYMAHHQGMILCAIDNSLCNDIHPRRFEKDLRMHAVSLLLHERVPQEVPSEVERMESVDLASPAIGSGRAPQTWIPPLETSSPQTHLLGNGSLSSWISTSGGGGLRWRHNALTRFLPDATLDRQGLWIYLHDDETGDIWSATRQPTDKKPDRYEVKFHSHIAEFHRRDHDISVGMEVGVADGDDIEIRKLCITNLADRPRSLRMTSYGEPVLAPFLDDERHPAFSKLFVASEFIPEIGGLLFTRRPRRPQDIPPVLLHFAVCDDRPSILAGFETDRRKFIGRNQTLSQPKGCYSDLPGSTGWTLDPVMALQLQCELSAHESREVAFVTVAAASREAAVEIAERYATLPSLEWAINDAASATVHEEHRLGIAPDDISEIQALGALLVYPHGNMRGDLIKLRENRLGQPSLWSLAISGDYPILLYKVGHAPDPLMPDLIRAHQFWRRQGLEVDLVIMQSVASGYIEPVRDDLMEWLQEIGAQWLLGRNGGIHLLFLDQIGPDQARLLEAVARVVIDDSHGPLKEQLARAFQMPLLLPHFEGINPAHKDDDIPELVPPDDLLFDNGFGGFTADGREYLIHLESGDTTPAPWVNILANDVFGTLVTEAGGGFSWAVNSGENRLTPWTNDPVTDDPVEILYLRDEETAEIWNPTPGPNGREAACQIRHGAGYSEWHKKSHGLDQKMRVFVAADDPVKIIRLRLANLTDRHRRITATYYVDWLLGALRSVSGESVDSCYDPENQAIIARNSWNPDFAERTAFLTADHPAHGLSIDRKEFLGREGTYEKPEGLRRWGMEGTTRAGMDPCGAYQVHLDLAAGASEEVTFILGQGENKAETDGLIARWKEPGKPGAAFDALTKYWDDLLGAIEVKTPDAAFDIMVNRWLLYQLMSSRLLARAGFYQASGAIGYRDQLQDVMAFLHNDPARARAHILDCAAHQFEQGDVLHWWHPPSDKGVRTRFSDDLLWLPYVVCEYVAATGDETILDEEVSYLQAPPLADDEDDRYAAFEKTSTRYSLHAHCHQALEKGFTHGRHGLPLMGAGDWNDGMDRVGHEGRGESVWLAWFVIVTAKAFAGLNRRIGQNRIADNWSGRADDLLESAEKAGWDGGWYRRAYDDDGQPWGSSDNMECRIDSISQSWALFAGADDERVKTGLAAAWRELVDHDNRIARLLTPPFDKTPRDPGYIKAYPPGIRENGGQYSHAAAWLGIALARAGETDKALDSFNMLSPVRRSANREQAEKYLVEPYASAADISGGETHGGRGGWTWYTGAAAWTWRLAVEEILGLKQENGKLHVNPALPTGWPGYSAKIRSAEGSIALDVKGKKDEAERSEIRVDGKPYKGMTFDFPTDGSERKVEIML